jgi:hypothetical protein
MISTQMHFVQFQQFEICFKKHLTTKVRKCEEKMWQIIIIFLFAAVIAKTTDVATNCAEYLPFFYILRELFKIILHMIRSYFV